MFFPETRKLMASSFFLFSLDALGPKLPRELVQFAALLAADGLSHHAPNAQRPSSVRLDWP
jgi:hypothetical protein